MKLSHLLSISTILLATIKESFAAYCTSHPRPAENNTQPIWDEEPRFIRQVPNGKLYQVGDPALNNTMYVVHLWGNMYQAGYAQGQLLKDELNEFLDDLWTYIESQVTDVLPDWIPTDLQEAIANFGAGAALDLTYYLTWAYTTPQYIDEMMGLSDASGVSLAKIRRIHMIGELTKAHCSMFGAWGNATLGNSTIQLRALDWDLDGPYRKHPAMIVYHPESSGEPGEFQGYPWANIGFIGWIGSISGINQAQMAISEIGISYKDETWGKESRIGNPFTFVLRDILQFDTNLTQAIDRLENEHRTCNLLLGVGDGKMGTFRGFQVSNTVMNVYDDTNLQPFNNTADTWHPRINNVVYWGMDWTCINWDIRFAEMLNQFHGNITAENTVRHILPGLTSGNVQTVIYDLTEMDVYVAYGWMTDDGSQKEYAYQRPYVHFNMWKQFNETKPEMN